jgi:hypothetical protein
MIFQKFSKSIDKSVKIAYTVKAMRIALFLTVGESLPESGRIYK